MPSLTEERASPIREKRATSSLDRHPELVAEVLKLAAV